MRIDFQDVRDTAITAGYWVVCTAGVFGVGYFCAATLPFGKENPAPTVIKALELCLWWWIAMKAIQVWKALGKHE